MAIALALPAVVALGAWLAVLLAPWAPWHCRERLEADAGEAAPQPNLTVLVPARNEAAVVGATLRALADAAPGARVVVIDDESSDGTAAAARASGLPHLTVLAGTPPPRGWTGKLWALQQGLAHVETPRVLLLDADIRLAPGILAPLARKLDEGCAVASLCAQPRFDDVAARWLLPAFVHFFKLLYPFALANRAGSRIAAAAGGVLLVDRRVLVTCGGFAAWRDAIIDDCALAAHVKRAGHRCWIGLTHAATSLRRTDLRATVQMIARTAFVQLRESLWRVFAATALLLVVFWAPLAAIALGPTPSVRWLGLLAFVAMAAAYAPTLRYYRRSALAALLLPATAGVFLWAMWLSAARALAGTRSKWKDRRYLRRPA